MIHYNVWFELKPEVPERDGLAAMEEFLFSLCAAGEAVSFQLLANKGKPPRSKLARYHAIVVFADDESLGRAMKNQVGRGIHAGLHGGIADAVNHFHVEVFSVIERDAATTIAGLLACEI